MRDLDDLARTDRLLDELGARGRGASGDEVTAALRAWARRIDPVAEAAGVWRGRRALRRVLVGGALALATLMGSSVAAAVTSSDLGRLTEVGRVVVAWLPDAIEPTLEAEVDGPLRAPGQPDDAEVEGRGDTPAPAPLQGAAQGGQPGAVGEGDPPPAGGTSPATTGSAPAEGQTAPGEGRAEGHAAPATAHAAPAEGRASTGVSAKARGQRWDADGDVADVASEGTAREGRARGRGQVGPGAPGPEAGAASEGRPPAMTAHPGPAADLPPTASDRAGERAGPGQAPLVASAPEQPSSSRLPASSPSTGHPPHAGPAEQGMSSRAVGPASGQTRGRPGG